MASLGLLVPLVLSFYCFLQDTEAQQNWGPFCNPDQWSTWKPPWDNFEPHVLVRTVYGDVKGFSVPWHVEDTYWNPCWQEHPPWFTRRVNAFLGIPYAQPPVGTLRFQRPKRPRWGGLFWDASYYRPVCPQELSYIRRDIPDFPKANVSEDCLYMNIFAPNYTNPDGSRVFGKYPVMVFLHKGDFLTGAAQTHPGHILATQHVVVVTLNYRLGALGFLSFQDQEAPGNYGLYDQHMALEFVKENIKAFQGDPDRITLAGDLAGAASVGFHLLSEMTRGYGYFHQCIMMSASDLSPFSFLSAYWRPQEYAYDLAERLGCTDEHRDTYRLIRCMRDNRTISWERILDLQGLVEPRDGKMGVVWAPTQDGGWFQETNSLEPQVPFLRYAPEDYRRMHMFDKMPCILGLNSQDGALKANESQPFLDRGMFKEEFRKFIEAMILSKGVQEDYRERALDIVEFQYTHWPDPENRSARTQEFINFHTDYNSGAPLNEVLKLQTEYEPQWFYHFTFKSWNDWIPKWMGVSLSTATDYVFGAPFMNETVLNETMMVSKMYYDYDDRNMSSWMMYMWTNFIREGNPTPNMTRNLTWHQYNYLNYSHLVIDYHSYIWFRYRQEKYGFWNEYFPSVARQEYYYMTPTPKGYEYVISTGALSAVLLVLLGIVALVGFLIYYQGEENRLARDYPEIQHRLGAQQSLSASRTTLTQLTGAEIPQGFRTYSAPQSSYPTQPPPGSYYGARPPKEGPKSRYWDADIEIEPVPMKKLSTSQHSLSSQGDIVQGAAYRPRGPPRQLFPSSGPKPSYTSHSVV